MTFSQALLLTHCHWSTLIRSKRIECCDSEPCRVTWQLTCYTTAHLDNTPVLGRHHLNTSVPYLIETLTETPALSDSLILVRHRNALTYWHQPQTFYNTTENIYVSTRSRRFVTFYTISALEILLLTHYTPGQHTCISTHTWCLFARSSSLDWLRFTHFVFTYR